MTRDTVLKQIYHKLITEGKCVLHSPNSKHHAFVCITWESIPEQIAEEKPATSGNYKIYTKFDIHGKWVFRTANPDLGKLTPYLRQHFAEFGTQGTDRDHQTWIEGLNSKQLCV